MIASYVTLASCFAVHVGTDGESREPRGNRSLRRLFRFSQVGSIMIKPGGSIDGSIMADDTIEPTSDQLSFFSLLASVSSPVRVEPIQASQALSLAERITRDPQAYGALARGFVARPEEVERCARVLDATDYDAVDDEEEEQESKPINNLVWAVLRVVRNACAGGVREAQEIILCVHVRAVCFLRRTTDSSSPHLAGWPEPNSFSTKQRP